MRLQDLHSMINPQNIIGRKYKYRRNAQRAIRRFKVKFFATIPKHYQFFIKNHRGQFVVFGMRD